MTYDETKRRYEHDAAFHACVDAMVGMIEQGIMTREDLARAAVFAAQRHAMIHYEPLTVVIQGQAMTLAPPEEPR
jgi:hypothetical protein